MNENCRLENREEVNGLENNQIERVLTMLLEKLQDKLKCSSCVLEISTGDFMVYRTATGTLSQNVGLGIRRIGSLSGYCVDTCETQCADDCETDERVDKAACKAFGVKSMVIAPIIREGQAIGALKATSDTSFFFEESTKSIIETTAGHLGALMADINEFRAAQELKLPISSQFTE